jgi:oxygen-independent coproporphyrinogen-3 oxidase
MSPDLVRRLSAPVPRYTSYPTAAHFKPDVGAAEFAESLSRLERAAPLSLYIHILFCRELCWYCGCSTKVVNGRAPIAEYLDALKAEMTKVAGLLGEKHPVSHIHWGGGSPNILAAADILDLADTLHRLFRVLPEAEFAVEIDPRSFSEDQAKAFATAGVTRVSVGVQDFDPAVQRAINRVQSFEVTEHAISTLRAAGIAAINIDLVYGLPGQTRDGVERTIARVIELDPERVALFGYAHLPSRAKHQSLIDAATLPNAVERFAQSQRARRLLKAAGYEAVGLDHFAKPGDPLASSTVRRNFQGYTTDSAEALIGFGASSISQLPDGYFQNAVARPDYLRRVREGGLATARGVLLSAEDRLRAFVIEKLMCELAFSKSALRAKFGKLAAGVIGEADDLLESDRDGLVEATPDGFRLTPRGEPFMRSIAACFDAYFDAPQTASSGV